MDRLITVYKCLYFYKTVEISQTFSYFSNNVSVHLSTACNYLFDLDLFQTFVWVRLVARKYIPFASVATVFCIYFFQF